MITLERLLCLLMGIIAAFELCAHLPGPAVYQATRWTLLLLLVVWVYARYVDEEEDAS